MSLVLFETPTTGVGHIILNDPHRLNAMGPDLAEAFETAVQAALEARVRLVVVRGAGRAFSAGGDLGMLEERQRHSLVENRAYMLAFYQRFLCLRDLGVPLVAALQGHCVGAGACLAMACDLRVAADDTSLAFAFTRLGLHPGLGITWFLPRAVGPAVAAELLLTGRPVKAAEALAVGLVNRVVPIRGLLAEVETLADSVLANGKTATEMMLQTLRTGLPGLPDTLQAEASAQAVSYGSEEFVEGLQAIRAKRPPRFD